MDEKPIKWPQKSREMLNFAMDSTAWNEFRFRDDDIIIASWAKSGTTWLQQIIGQLLFDGRPDLPIAEMSPWLDLRVPPKTVKLQALEEQTHRRFLKTHLPVDALVFSPKARYLYIARDGRDAVWSMYNHHVKANGVLYETLNETPGRVGPPIGPPAATVRQYFLDWLEKDGHPWWPYWENVRTWWEIRALPNVMLLHFTKLKEDMPGAIRHIAAFLDIPINETEWPAILEHCSFDYMKSRATGSVPLGGAFWDGGAQTFIYQGINGRWRTTLTEADCAAYEERAQRELGPDCAHWLKTGDLP